MFSLIPGDRRPLYLQIKERFRTMIVTGLLAEGDKIPSVRELAASLAINPNTIQKAYRELEAEGWILSLPGKGSFVSPAENRRVARRIGELYADLAAAAKELAALGESRENMINEIDNAMKEEENEHDQNRGNS